MKPNPNTSFYTYEQRLIPNYADEIKTFEEFLSTFRSVCGSNFELRRGSAPDSPNRE